MKVPGGRTTELLVRLALDAGLFVRVDRIIDDLWGAAALGTSRNTLQSKVAKLRRAVAPELIVSSEGAYKLAIDPSGVDALKVLGDSIAAAQLLDEGEDESAAALSGAALGMYRGEVLPGAGDGAWTAPHRGRLEEARMRLVETNFAARMRLGESGELIGDLEAAVAESPYQEGLWELLIGALYAVGRQADALAAYQRVRSALADDLGLAPGPGLVRLERQVLVQDPALGASIDDVGSSPPAPAAGNLPSLPKLLVGRDGEIEIVLGLLEHGRLVEIIGPGGVGKTALAVAVGQGLAASAGKPSGGVWMVALEAATTDEEVLDAAVAALGLTGGEAALLERLRDAAAVLILDNCEHVLDAAASLSRRLLDATGDVRILCTSQVALDVDGESLVELAPLSLDQSIELFAERATRRRGGRPITVDEGGIRELCGSLDGLPLAIELAAARSRTLSVEEIGRRLGDRFGVLRDPTSRRPERRRALEATIRWSYDLLFPDDQRGLWALSTFAGGGTLEAVEAVLEALDVPRPAVIDVLERLAARSLVIVDEPAGSAPLRYRLLDSIRAFAAGEMDREGGATAAGAAHATWFATAADASMAGVRSSRQAEFLDLARSERSNIDAALNWCTVHDPPLGLRIANGFGWAWIVLGDSRGAQRILTALNAVGDSAAPRDRARALLLCAWLEASTDQLGPAHEHLAEVAEIASAAGDVELQGRHRYHLAYVVSHQGDFERGIELTAQSAELLEQFDLPWDQGANALFAARAAISAGDLERSAAARDQVEHWLRMVDDPWLHVRREAMLGELARVEHRFGDAVRHIARAARTSERLGFMQTEAYQLSSLGRAQCQDGDYESGAATIELAIEKAERTGDLRLAALARVHLGRVLRALGRPGEARSALEAADAWHREAGGGEQRLLGECLLAALDSEEDVAGARERLESILADSRAAGDAPAEVLALDALARIAAGDGDGTTARALGDAADRRMLDASHFIAELDRADARVAG